MTRQAKPTLFHHMLATLAEEGRLLRLYTQNIDGIDTALEPLKTSVPLSPKGPWPKTIQLHGGLEKMVCTKCGELSDFSGELFEGSEAPSCSACEEIDNIRTMMAGKRSHGIGRLRPRIVLYNEYNPDSEAIGAVTHADLKARPDAIIVVGTSMKIPGVKRIVREMCQVTRGRKDGMAIWINQDPAPPIPELKDCWDLVIRGDCDEVARRVALPRWDDKDIGLYNEVTDEEVAATKMKVKIEIEGEVKNKAVDKVQGMVTPSRSPRSRSPAVFKDLKKMKQPQLSFGKGAEKMVEKPAKPASKKETKSATAKAAAWAARRKPVLAKKAAAGGITNAFKTSKVTKVLDGKTEKVAKDSTMRDLPPHHLRRNSELPSATLDGKALVVEIPVSPETYALETVSPKQIPRGMAHLLDG
jgi:NAD-dependent histone deacetylase SIR2